MLTSRGHYALEGQKPGDVCNALQRNKERSTGDLCNVRCWYRVSNECRRPYEAVLWHDNGWQCYCDRVRLRMAG